MRVVLFDLKDYGLVIKLEDISTIELSFFDYLKETLKMILTKINTDKNVEFDSEISETKFQLAKILKEKIEISNFMTEIKDVNGDHVIIEYPAMLVVAFDLFLYSIRNIGDSLNEEEKNYIKEAERLIVDLLENIRRLTNRG